MQKLHDVTEQALKMPAVQEKLAKLGVEPAQISTAEFAKFFNDDFDATIELAKKANIKSVDSTKAAPPGRSMTGPTEFCAPFAPSINVEIPS